MSTHITKFKCKLAKLALSLVWAYYLYNFYTLFFEMLKEKKISHITHTQRETIFPLPFLRLSFDFFFLSFLQIYTGGIIFIYLSIFFLSPVSSSTANRHFFFFFYFSSANKIFTFLTFFSTFIFIFSMTGYNLFHK